ncbi:MAG: hypothetical protein FJ087_21600 [Deltaproteobacteria bacterium]|nr:hypothetical protein [Deltaproteobacteria bacterium]
MKHCSSYLAAVAQGLVVPRPAPGFKQCVACGNLQVNRPRCKKCGGTSFRYGWSRR